MLLEPRTIHELSRDDRDFTVSPMTLAASTFLTTMTAAMTASAPAIEKAPTAIALGVGTLATTGLLLVNTYKEAGRFGSNAEIHLENMKMRLMNSFEDPEVEDKLSGLYRYLTNTDFAKSYISGINRTSGSAVDYLEARKNPEGVTIVDYIKVRLMALQEMTLLTLQEGEYKSVEKVDGFIDMYGREPWSWVGTDARKFLSQLTQFTDSFTWSEEKQAILAKFEEVFNLQNQTTQDFLRVLLVSGDVRNIQDLLKLSILEQMPEEQISKTDNGDYLILNLTRSLINNLTEAGMPHAQSHRNAFLRIANQALSYLNPSTRAARQEKSKKKRAEAHGRAYVLSDRENRVDRVNPALINDPDEYTGPISSERVEQSTEEA